MAVLRGKYVAVAERLSRRISNGDYHVHGVPAERELASQVGVSYTTIRKAIQRLIDAGLLYRQANGRLAVKSAGEQGTAQKQVALLAPAWESNEVNAWNIALAHLRSQFNFSSRVVHYVHWDDPIILNTIQQFDATFMLPQDAPPEFMEGLKRTAKRPIILNRDWSGDGFRSLRLLPPHFIHKLLDHLATLGHRRIDCLNVQHAGPVIRDWIGQWQLWLSTHRMDGELISEPGKPFTDTLVAAYNTIAQRLRDGNLRTSAIFCLTDAMAIGATRAMLDAGIRPGHDIAVVTVGSTRCEYASPSITSLEETDPKPYLAACLEWAFAGEEDGWRGPMLVQPPEREVVVRESTVPGIDKTQTPLRVQRMEQDNAQPA